MAGAFAAKLLDWVVAELRRLGKPLARILVGTNMADVDVNRSKQTKSRVEKLIEASLKEGHRVTIILDPREGSSAQPGRSTRRLRRR